ncbi:hypothetical protein [Streptomyces syringium]|uniref:hypothetical protein n=1 Tax=Streptomyces syringium TaxID=76729 RepID=UPI0033E38E0B
MTDTSPAAVLRAAADHLRALAAAASTDGHGSPTACWDFEEYCFHSGEGRGAGMLYATDDGPYQTRLLHGAAGRGGGPRVHRQHGEYIAAVNPAVGLALADLLADLAHGDAFGEINPWALALAQRLLGEDTSR